MTNLPAEVLYNMFALSKESDTRRSLYNCSLVCKKWNQPSQHLLYSKVAFNNKTKLNKFVKTIKSNKQLADIVKEVQLSIPPVHVHFSIAMSNTRSLPFADLFNYLPNLEVFGSRYEMNYLSLLDALSNSKLQKLKSINVLPLDGVNYDLYATCMMFIKNRAESLVLADKTTISDLRKRIGFRDPSERGEGPDLKGRERFDRLYNNIHLFPQLREILLTSDTNDPINILESVTEKCPNLNTLRFDLQTDDEKPLARYSSGTILNYTPTPNITTLHGIEIEYYLPLFLNYIMHKFPQLEKLFLDTKNIDVPMSIEKEVAMKFISYMSKINSVTVYGLCLKVDDFYDIIRGFWSDPSNHGVDNVEIEYTNDMNDAVIADIVKNDMTRSKKNRNRLCVQFDRLSGNLLPHKQLIEEFGENFKSLSFSRSNIDLLLDISTLAREAFHGNFIDHIVCHCPNLLDLRIARCQLKKIDFTNLHILNRLLKFRILSISNSKLNANVFEELSFVSRSITHFKLIKNFYCFAEDRHKFSADIKMPNTAIRTLTIDFSNERSLRVYINLFTSITKDYCYYKYTFQSAADGVLEPCHEHEHKQSRGSFVIHIRCRILNNLEIIRGDETASLSSLK